MSRGFGLAVAAGLASGLVFLSVMTGGTIGALLVYLVPLPLVMAGLALGLRPLVAGTLTALGLVGLFEIAAVPTFAVVAVVPALALVRQSLLRRQGEDGSIEWYPPGRILAWLTAIAACLLLLGAAVMAEQGLGIEEPVRRQMVVFVDELAPVITSPEARDGLVSLWTALMPAMAGCAWLAIVVLNGVLAQWTVARAGHALRPTPAYGGLALPAWVGIALAASLAVGLTASGDVGYMARNLAVLLAWPYVFAGLAAVHQWVRGRPHAGLLLAGFYVAFFALFGWALIAVAGLGLVRHWTRLWRQGAGGQEEK